MFVPEKKRGPKGSTAMLAAMQDIKRSAGVMLDMNLRILFYTG